MWGKKSDNILYKDLLKIFEKKIYKKDPQFFFENSLYQKNPHFFEVFVTMCKNHDWPFKKLVFLTIYEYSKLYLTDAEIKNLFIDNLHCGSIEKLTEYLDVQLNDGAIFKENDIFFYKLLDAYEKIIFSDGFLDAYKKVISPDQKKDLNIPPASVYFKLRKYLFFFSLIGVCLLSSLFFLLSSSKKDEIINLQVGVTPEKHDDVDKTLSTSSDLIKEDNNTLKENEENNSSLPEDKTALNEQKVNVPDFKKEYTPQNSLTNVPNLINKDDNNALKENEEIYRSLHEEKTTLPEQNVNVPDFKKEYTPKNSLTDDYNIVFFKLNKSFSGYFRKIAQPKFLQEKNTVSAIDLPLKPIPKEDFKEQDGDLILDFITTGKLVNIPVPYGYSVIASNKGNLLKNDDSSYFVDNAKGDTKVILRETKEYSSFFPSEVKEVLPLSNEVKQFVQTTLKDSNNDQKIFVEKIKNLIQSKQYNKLYQETFVKQAKNTIDYFNILYNTPGLECYSANLLLMAMLREAGIPAQKISGYHINDSNKITSANGHAWTEVFLDNYWTVVDATPTKNDEMQLLKEKKQEEKVKQQEEKVVEKIKKEEVITSKEKLFKNTKSDALLKDLKTAETREQLNNFSKIIFNLSDVEVKNLEKAKATIKYGDYADIGIKWNFSLRINEMNNGDYSKWKEDNRFTQLGLHYTYDNEWKTILSILPVETFVQLLKKNIQDESETTHIRKILVRNSFEIPKKIIETSPNFADIYPILNGFFNANEKDFLYSYFFLKRKQDLDKFIKDGILPMVKNEKDILKERENLRKLLVVNSFEIPKRIIETSPNFADIYSILNWEYFDASEKDFLYSYFFLKRKQNLNKFIKDDILPNIVFNKKLINESDYLISNIVNKKLMSELDYLIPKNILQTIKTIEDINYFVPKLSAVLSLDKNKVIEIYIKEKMYKNIPINDWKSCLISDSDNLNSDRCKGYINFALEYNNFEILNWILQKTSTTEIITTLQSRYKELSWGLQLKLLSNLNPKKIEQEQLYKVIKNVFYQNPSSTPYNFLVFLCLNLVVFLIWQILNNNKKWSFFSLPYLLMVIYFGLLMSLQYYLINDLIPVFISIFIFLYLILIFQKNWQFINKNQKIIWLLLMSEFLLFFFQDILIYFEYKHLFVFYFVAIFTLFFKLISQWLKYLSTMVSNVVIYFVILVYFISLYQSIGYLFGHNTEIEFLENEFPLFFGILVIKIITLLLFINFFRSNVLDIKTQHICKQIHQLLIQLKNKHKFFSPEFLNDAKDYYKENEGNKDQYLNNNKQVFPKCLEISSQKDAKILSTIFYCQFPYLFSSLDINNINEIQMLAISIRIKNEELFLDIYKRLTLILNYCNQKVLFDAIVKEARSKNIIIPSFNDYMVIIKSSVNSKYKRKLQFISAQNNQNNKLCGINKSDNYFFDKANEEDAIHILDFKKTDQLGVTIVKKYFSTSHVNDVKNIVNVLVLNLLTIDSKKFWHDLTKFFKTLEQKNLSQIDVYFYSTFSQVEASYWQSIKGEESLQILQKSIKTLFEKVKVEKAHTENHNISNINKEVVITQVENLFFAFGVKMKLPYKYSKKIMIYQIGLE